MKYTAQVNSFMPASTIPFLAWAATCAEFGLRTRADCRHLVALGRAGQRSAAGLFGIAMAISFGIKAPLDYSVFSASAGALVLAVYHNRKSEPN